jgi:uncharacterized integral membrane protein
MSESSSSSNRTNWLGLLGIIFVLCKIFEVQPIADWSWWLVLLPFYLGLAISLGIMLIGAAGAGLFIGGATVIQKAQEKKRKQQREKDEVWRRLKDK